MMNTDNQLINRLRSRSFKAIIFDFDGTLLNIRGAMEKAIEEIFNEYRIEADMDITIQEIGALLETLQGYPLPKIILNSHDLVKEISAFDSLTFLKKILISTKIFSKYLEYAKEASLFDGTKKLLKKLDKKLGYDLYIVSHNKKDNIIFHLEKNGIEKHFKGVFGTDDLPSLKPHPNSLEPAIKDYPIKIKRSEFLMIGDMPTDIEAGKEAGFGTIAIASGISNKDILVDFNPDLLVASLEELYELINQDNISNSKNQESLKIKS